MHVGELTESERNVLFALLAHIAEADDRIDPDEVLEIDALGEEMGVDNLRERLMRARAATHSPEALASAMASVERPDARDLIRTLLYDLARADGEQHESENEILDRLDRAWGKR